jgi:DnaK suppressor protein
MVTPIQDKTDFEALLRKMREASLRAQESGSEAEKTVELDQARVGRLSRMDALQAQAMSIETNRRRRLQLQRIEAALQRIREGVFGNCVACGEPIAAGRLAADPTVTLCIGCASSGER